MLYFKKNSLKSQSLKYKKLIADKAISFFYLASNNQKNIPIYC